MLLNEPMVPEKLRTSHRTVRGKKMPIPQTKEEECEEVLKGFQK